MKVNSQTSTTCLNKLAMLIMKLLEQIIRYIERYVHHAKYMTSNRAYNQKRIKDYTPSI